LDLLRDPFTYTIEMMAKKLPKEIRAYFSKLGKKGGKKGGAARASNMTQEQRTESARNAVIARWAKLKNVNDSESP
jgi:hypothetical protein